ncbi:ATP-dependent zinc protease [Halopseudomonas pelagia]|uniref:ATP-dependent zinc protease n=1 Tax=Halopseudomonas pelagia TaxID=553151 RepID=A0AA91U437_9GAMM|nr:ATP-dependent zinc protease [Halopseudomonas pelagia]PCD00198.1 ATP-dependent zinc protease [Halopseudomonas pelagia]QFY56858.1 ATP-dependent zinc protease [Halopseudomonas pelagia]
MTICSRHLFSRRLLAATLLGLCTAAPLALAESDSLGWIEKGLVLPERVAVKFKLDTGALTSSMHAEDIDEFEKDGDDWVRFSVELEDVDRDEKIESTFEREVRRYIKVRGAGGAERRPVVMMKICIGDKVYDEQFSLNDRDRMNYPVLIGRRTLENIGAVVDSSKTFTTEPDCSNT